MADLVLGNVEKVLSDFRNALADPVISALVIIFISSILVIGLYVINAKSSKKHGVLILGLCDSGKTLLFSLLTLKRSVVTHTSVRENKAKYTIKNGKKLEVAEIVDLPGHERIRGKYIKKYEDNARCIIFMVDSATFPRQIRDVAEFTYDILTSKTLMNSKPALIICCNKQDLPTAKSCSVIRSQLEKEIEAMRSTRAAALKGTDEAQAASHVDVGKKGKPFEFCHVGSNVEFMECDLKKKNIASVESIMSWIEDVFL